MSADVLPRCTTREIRNRITVNGVVNVPVHCMNCGKHYGYCPEYMTEPSGGYAGYLCDDCATRWSPLVGTMIIPDMVFAQKANEAQLEQYGRVLTPDEQARVLDDPDSLLSKLARDRV